MTTDLWMLVYAGLLGMVIPLVYVVGRMQAPGGMQWALGNRDTALDVPAWAARAQRAHGNLTENLPLFAILVLVAHVSDNANSATAVGAQMFFWARLAHMVVYTAGITILRTVLFFVGAAGELLMLVQLFR